LYRELHRPIHLLLVEDNPADAKLLEFALQEGQAKYQLSLALDGQQALEYLQGEQNRPDLILLDLNLPRLNGHQVLRALKADPRLRAIPVVVLTSSRAPSDILEAYGQGASSYLAKPVSLDETFDLVRTIEHYWLDLALLPALPMPYPRSVSY
jgi:chemotaxis family two-component system response regulator Rcp1